MRSSSRPSIITIIAILFLVSPSMRVADAIPTRYGVGEMDFAGEFEEDGDTKETKGDVGDLTEGGDAAEEKKNNGENDGAMDQGMSGSSNPQNNDYHGKQGFDASFDKSYSSAPSTSDVSMESVLPPEFASSPFVAGRSSSGYSLGGSGVTGSISSGTISNDEKGFKMSLGSDDGLFDTKRIKAVLLDAEKANIFISAATGILSLLAARRQWGLWSNIHHPPKTGILKDQFGKEYQVLMRGSSQRAPYIPIFGADTKLHRYVSNTGHEDKDAVDDTGGEASDAFARAAEEAQSVPAQETEKEGGVESKENAGTGAAAEMEKKLEELYYRAEDLVAPSHTQSHMKAKSINDFHQKNQIKAGVWDNLQRDDD